MSFRYLKSKANRMEIELKSTFSELFVHTLIHTLEAIHKEKQSRTRSRNEIRVGEHKEINFLPDLQVWDKTYSSKDLDPARRILSIDPSKCLIISLRAGVLLNPDSQQTARTFLHEFENTLLLVHSKPYDLITMKMLEDIHANMKTRRVVFQTDGVRLGQLNILDESNAARNDGSRVKRPRITNRGATLRCHMWTMVWSALLSFGMDQP